MKKWLLIISLALLAFVPQSDETAWIRINLLGYTPESIKVAVWCSKEDVFINEWELVDAVTGAVAWKSNSVKRFGSYGPFAKTARLDFSSYKKPGRFFIRAGGVNSPVFRIDNTIYEGTADFCLRYMRQQRTGYNPFLKDSCHTQDGYVLYGAKAGIPDSTRIDVVGGWHDASDYLQYATTSANATAQLLMAYRDYPVVFTDEKLANGLDGKNKIADVLDEAKWGLDWLLKMHPRDEWMFNQIADDRDHMGMRIPAQDSFYGRGYERPVYFLSGEPQQRGKFLNRTTGTASTAGKFSSAFALGCSVFMREVNNRPLPGHREYGLRLQKKALSAFAFARQKPGNTQTASVKSPYIYAEDNWKDDMELAAATISNILGHGITGGLYTQIADSFAHAEPLTPWLGADTASHYQWYPFINLGHYELAKQLQGARRDTITGYYRKGINRVWNKAKDNAFYRGVPFIWCSNNLTVSFAIQCHWYRELTGDKRYAELEQANLDWLFGCNPWGTSMVYGLPAGGDTPVDPHSAFTHLKNYPIDGGLVDGPVYGSIYRSLIGIQLKDPDEYAAFQSDLAVYHDDYGDYSTNEPTMDGTASLIYLLAAKEADARPSDFLTGSYLPKPAKSEKAFESAARKKFTYQYGAITRGDSSKKKLALVFTGDEYAESGDTIERTLLDEEIRASFFFTGRFYENSGFKNLIQRLRKGRHYLGPHSQNHLLYCDWTNRKKTLVSKPDFETDLQANLRVMHAHGIDMENVTYFLPPFEWYNDSIAAWTKESGLRLINNTGGTLSAADYTTPAMKNYRSSEEIYQSIVKYEQSSASGLNGFILLLHIGSGPERRDRFSRLLPQLIRHLKSKGYQFQTVNELLKLD